MYRSTPLLAFCSACAYRLSCQWRRVDWPLFRNFALAGLGSQRVCGVYFRLRDVYFSHKAHGSKIDSAPVGSCGPFRCKAWPALSARGGVEVCRLLMIAMRCVTRLYGDDVCGATVWQEYVDGMRILLRSGRCIVSLQHAAHLEKCSHLKFCVVAVPHACVQCCIDG